MRKILLKFDLLSFSSVKLFNYLKRQVNLNNVELEKLYLGIMILVFNISELILVFITAFFIGIIKEVLILSIIFAILRLTAAGLHCKSSLGCLITTLASCIGSSYISIKYPLNIYNAFVISIICTLILFKYAPADTENRPILGIQHRKKLKILTMLVACTLIFINLILFDKVLFNLTMFALIIESLSVLPCSYKVIKANYNNYKKYELA